MRFYQVQPEQQYFCGIEWVGGLFNRPGDFIVPLTMEAINGLGGVLMPLLNLSFNTTRYDSRACRRDNP